MKRFGEDFVQAHLEQIKTLNDLRALRALAQRLNDEAVTAKKVAAQLDAAVQAQLKRDRAASQTSANRSGGRKAAQAEALKAAV